LPPTLFLLLPRLRYLPARRLSHLLRLLRVPRRQLGLFSASFSVRPSRVVSVASFAKDMSREFEMSMMGELQFFLGLQIKQSKEGTFVHQAKYTKDIVRKFKMEDSKAMMTPMSTTTALDADEKGEHVDQKEYRSMIGSLLNLKVTRPDI
jgi:hypothetical protein